MVRRIDHWEDCWEHKQGQVYKTTIQVHGSKTPFLRRLTMAYAAHEE
jgi:hypothetical protein